MYTITNADEKAIYEEAMLSATPVLGVRLKLHYASGAEFVVPKDKILSSGLNILRQATNSNSFNLGSCCIDTLSIETTLDAPGVRGATTNVTQFILEAGYGTTDDNIVYIPIGYYRMQAKSCSKKNGRYQLKLQSFMAALDKNLPKVFDYGSKTIKEWLEWLCTKIKIRNVKGSEQDQYMYLSSDINYSKLANQDFSFAINNETGYSTYRDILKDLALVSGAFATFDRSGGLILLPFRNSSTMDTSIQTSSLVSLSENMEKFTVDQIRCVQAQTVTSEEGTTEENIDYSYPTEVNTDDYYDISGLKIFNAMADRAIANGIATHLYSFIGNNNYDATPFEAQCCVADFRIDLGDWVLVNDIDSSTRSAQIMRIEYQIPGKAKYVSYQNPSNNDQNATQRSSYTSNNVPTSTGGGGGTTVIVDQTAQWAFNT